MFTVVFNRDGTVAYGYAGSKYWAELSSGQEAVEYDGSGKRTSSIFRYA